MPKDMFSIWLLTKLKPFFFSDPWGCRHTWKQAVSIIKREMIAEIPHSVCVYIYIYISQGAIMSASNNYSRNVNNNPLGDIILKKTSFF